MGWVKGAKNPASIGAFAASAPITVDLSVSSARSVQLAPFSAYRIWASVDCFIRFGDGTVQATTSSHPLTAKSAEPHLTDDTNLFCAGIVSSGSGKLYISPMELY